MFKNLTVRQDKMRAKGQRDARIAGENDEKYKRCAACRRAFREKEKELSRLSTEAKPLEGGWKTVYGKPDLNKAIDEYIEDAASIIRQYRSLVLARPLVS
jgi:hypothetical protein